MLLFINLKIIKGDPMFIKTLSTALLSIFFSAAISAPASAKNYEINVNGIVCEFCAFGVAKKLRKLDFIDPLIFDINFDAIFELAGVYKV